MKKMIIGFVILFLSQSLAFEFLTCNSSSTHIIRNNICKLDEKYDQTAVPMPIPLILDSEINMYEVTDIDEIDHSITVYMSLNVKWSDKGLAMENKYK